MVDLTVIILTYNEELHIERCIQSVKSFAKEIIVVDSFSTDRTLEIAQSIGAKIYQNKFVNQAQQFQWALNNCDIKTQWIMRLDADEYVLPELAKEIQLKLSFLSEDISGIYIKRRVYFMGKWIKHGGYYPTWLLRIWRYGCAKVEQRWMDEHIKVLKGKTIKFENDIVDENLNNLTWWINKHNSYATREAIDLLNAVYNFLEYDEISAKLFGAQEQRKRWLKYRYAKLPLFIRPTLYFLYRYFLKAGFLDGREGLIWHFLQGFWYRFLVDAKIFELEKFRKKRDLSLKEAIKELYGIEV